jgi:hypothetical protein
MQPPDTWRSFTTFVQIPLPLAKAWWQALEQASWSASVAFRHAGACAKGWRKAWPTRRIACMC